MAVIPDVVWLNPNPSWQRFHRPLMKYLSQEMDLIEWEYRQTPDEPSSFDAAIDLLHQYLGEFDRPIRLIGHSTGGLLGLLYARRYPERVKSLALLAVGCHPAIDWQAHYYVQRQLLPCSRQIVLAQMVRSIVGSCPPQLTRAYVRWLETDLELSPSGHSLWRQDRIVPGGVSVPLFVAGSRRDAIVDRSQLQGWVPWLKPGDCLWEHPDGSHVFHYFDPQSVGDRILKFWQTSRERMPVCQALV
ncbi:MAG: alpha/beta hydrolase [Cyanobacteria bacterium SID2]|nr:alpha/beta hydrolase [Cyanobacteria bacterium SID2]MBP0005667.1 alpha/beta hydrolase [Cyanobacteria bacterium SBC]